MGQLPTLSSRDIIRVLKRFGFQEDRQKGSHLILLNAQSKRRVVIPIHPGKTIKKPLARAIIQDDAGLTIEEFLKEL